MFAQQAPGFIEGVATTTPDMFDTESTARARTAASPSRLMQTYAQSTSNHQGSNFPVGIARAAAIWRDVTFWDGAELGSTLLFHVQLDGQLSTSPAAANIGVARSTTRTYTGTSVDTLFDQYNVVGVDINGLGPNQIQKNTGSPATASEVAWDTLLITGDDNISHFSGRFTFEVPYSADAGGFVWAIESFSFAAVFGTSTAVSDFFSTTSLAAITDMDGNPVEVTFDSSILLPPVLDGDANRDGFVGVEDLDLVLAEWGNTLPASSASDIDGDGSVGQSDLDLIIANWGAGTPPGANIPEPGSLAMLTVGMGLFAKRRRQSVAIASS